MLGGRYVLEDKIAGGGMATVWRARDEILARTVAVKILHPNLAVDAAFVERFRREALAAARLAHPHIVAIYDTGAEQLEDDDRESHYIVMEHCGEGTLDTLLQKDGPMDPHRVASIGATICDALEYAHQNGIVHRDIKPPNVLLSDHGVLKVADFGIAKAAFASSDITSTGTILGTVTYLSPEQVNGQEPGPSSDLYSLGILLHELTCGQPPFRAETQIATAMAHTRTPPPPLGQMRGGVPRDLERVVLKALEKKPEDRYSSAAEMAGALRAVSDRSSTSVLPTRSSAHDSGAVTHGTQPDTGHDRSVLRTLIPLVALVAIAVTAAFVIPGLIEGEETPGERSRRTRTGAGAALEIGAIEDFDPPPGDGQEHADELPAAIDGDPTTTWSTESYSTPLQDQKEGVGLVLDLGDEFTVENVEVSTTTPGFTFEIRTATELADDLAGFELVSEETTAESTTAVELEDPTDARFVLIWITSLPDGGPGSATVSEVTASGS
jgi:eukaryotic-like serine/threonine-protein kinase